MWSERKDTNYSILVDNWRIHLLEIDNYHLFICYPIKFIQDKSSSLPTVQLTEGNDLKVHMYMKMCKLSNKMATALEIRLQAKQ